MIKLRCWLVLFLSNVVFVLMAQQPFMRTYTKGDGLLDTECHGVEIMEDGRLAAIFSEGVMFFDGKDFLECDTKAYKDFSDIDYNRRYAFKEGVLFLHREFQKLIFIRNDGSSFQLSLDEPLFVVREKQKDTIRLIDRSFQFYELNPKSEKINDIDNRLSFEIDQEDLRLLELHYTDMPNKAYVRTMYRSTDQKNALYEFNPQEQSPKLQLLLENHYSVTLLDDMTFLVRKSSEPPYQIWRNGNLSTLNLRKKDGQSAILQGNLGVFLKTKGKFYAELLMSNTGIKYHNLYSVKNYEDLVFIGKIPHELMMHDGYSSQLSPFKHSWICSHQGLTRVNTGILEFPSSDPDMITSLHTITEDEKGRIWFGSYDGGFSYFDGKKLYRANHPSISNDRVLPGGYSNAEREMYFLLERREKPLLNYQKGKWYAYSTPKRGRNHEAAGFYIDTLRNGKFVIGFQQIGLGIVDNIKDTSTWKIIGEDKGLKLGNVLHATEDQSGKIWMGRLTTGLACYDPQRDSVKTWEIDNSNPSSFGSICGELDSRGNLWLGGRGLRLLRQPEQYDPFELDLFQQLETISLINGDETFVTFCLQYRDYMIFGTKEAIYFLDLNYFYSSNEPRIFSLEYSKDINGAGSEQNAAFIDSKGYLWVGLQEGAARLDLEQIVFDTTGAEIILDYLCAGDDTLAVKEEKHIGLPTGKRNIRLGYEVEYNPYLYDKTTFDYVVYRSNEGDTLYKVQNTSDREVVIPYLAPDQYTFSIVAKKDNFVADQYNLEVNVPKTIGESQLFWAALVILFSSALIFVLVNRNRSKRKELEREMEAEKSKREKDRLFIQSIAGSLNPHFINNSLHWVASKYRKDQELTSMMSSLSRNIAVVFKYTRNGKTDYTLEEEMELISNYLNICNTRFGAEEHIEIMLPDYNVWQKWKDYSVIIMQLQIHVENAIGHGIRHRKEASSLKIGFKEQDNHLILTIEDDGIGRKKARYLKSHNTQQGISMLNEVIDIYNKYNEQKITWQYEDLIFINPQTQERFGTRVIIKLPKNYSYEF